MSITTSEFDFDDLHRAAARAAATRRPAHIDDLYAASPSMRATDRLRDACRAAARVAAVPKPAICLLGAYASGKTFLLNHVLQRPGFFSGAAWAVVTVVRHMEDKPKDWPPDRNVFTLKEDCDLRSPDLDSATGQFCYEDQPGLTWRSSADKPDVVLVFLDHDILRRCVLCDCPGGGTMAESTFERDADSSSSPWLTEPQQRYVREQRLRLKAISSADAYLVVSPVAGANGAFADANTGNLLHLIAKHHAVRLPGAGLQDSILFVGTVADPWKQGL